MHLIALLIWLFGERITKHFFHLHRMRWINPIIDFGLRHICIKGWPSMPLVMILIFLMVLPVFLIVFSFGNSLQGFTYLVISVIVLFFSAGPKDLREEIDEYCKALAYDDEKRVQLAAEEIIEDRASEDPYERTINVEEAICIQANNRLFSIIFWFVFLGSFTSSMGPLAAWTYRVVDLIRRRSSLKKKNKRDFSIDETGIHEVASFLHAVMAWVPAKLTALGYATAGHADNAIAALRTPGEDIDDALPKSSEKLLARVGLAALAINENEEETIHERAIRGAVAAKRLVSRLLFIWAAVIAMLTLYGFTR